MSFLVPSYLGSTASNSVDLIVDNETINQQLTVDNFTVTGSTTTTGLTTNAGPLTVSGVLTTQGGTSVKITVVNTLPYTVLASDTWVRIGGSATGVLTLGSTANQTVRISLSSGVGAVTMQGSGSSYSIRLNGTSFTAPITLYPSTVIVVLTEQIGPPAVFEVLGLEGQVGTGFKTLHNTLDDGSGNVVIVPTGNSYPHTIYNNSLGTGSVMVSTIGLSQNTNNYAFVEFSNVAGNFSTSNWARFGLGGTSNVTCYGTGKILTTSGSILEDGSGNMTVTGAVTTNGGLVYKQVSTSVTYQALNTDTFILVGSTGTTITLPASPVVGQVLHIATGASASTTIAGTIRLSGQQITTLALSQYAMVDLVYGTNGWYGNASWINTATLATMTGGLSLTGGATMDTATLTTTSATPLQIYNSALATSSSISKLIGINSSSNNAAAVTFTNVAGSGSSTNYARFGLTGGNGATVDGSGNLTVANNLTYNNQLLSSSADGTLLDTKGNIAFKSTATGADVWYVQSTYQNANTGSTFIVNNSTTSAAGNVVSHGVFVASAGLVLGPTTSKTANYTVGGFDGFIPVTTSGVTITLFNSAGIQGRFFVINNQSSGAITISNGTNNIYVNGTGATTYSQAANTLMTYYAGDAVPTYYGK